LSVLNQRGKRETVSSHIGTPACAAKARTERLRLSQWLSRFGGNATTISRAGGLEWPTFFDRDDQKYVQENALDEPDQLFCSRP
jgi:hypothetical protein